MIIFEGVKFFVKIMNDTWWALGRFVIPGTIVNGQFLFVFSLLLALGWKFVLIKTLPPTKVDNIEIDNDTSVQKRKEKFNKFSRKVSR